MVAYDAEAELVSPPPIEDSVPLAVLVPPPTTTLLSPLATLFWPAPMKQYVFCV